MNVAFFFCWLQEEDGTGGDQDQEERRWNKRTQQMLHGLQVYMMIHFIRIQLVPYWARPMSI